MEISKVIPVPQILSLLMEVGYQNIEFEIPVEILVEYQDIAGKEYKQNFEVIISVESIEEINEEIEMTYLYGELKKNGIGYLPRQQVAFREKDRKSEGLESLEGDFYTRFKPKN